MRGVLNWLEERTGLPSAAHHFLMEDIPASSGWHQVFGSIALFSFLVQMVTGILLSMNYAPTPGEAWNSVRYIMTELTAGPMIRGLHHWGASIMIVVVVLHMAQVFIWGSYKRPREGTWLIGVVLLLLTLAYGLTGYLLPWDNRAYWGTIVATQIGASIPGAGDWITRLLGAENGIGVVTFARFYAIHVLVLPPATLLLIAIHVFLVRRHGVAPAPGDERLPKMKFYPGQVFKDTVAIFVTFAILFALAATVRVPLERLADPTDTSYIPRPDWYFLFLFQMLKFFEGPAELLGSVILPNIAILLLILAPWIDRSPATRVKQRKMAMGVVALAALTWSGLTYAAIRSTPPTEAIDVTLITAPQQWQYLTAVEQAGAGLYKVKNCKGCHEEGANKLSPELLGKAKDMAPADLIAHFKNPSGDEKVTPVPFAGFELATMVQLVKTARGDKLPVLDSVPSDAADAALLYQKNQCGTCHTANGAGGKAGPLLNGLAERRDRHWLEEHFMDPQKVSPGTNMPPYKFAKKDMDKMTAWLLGIPGS